MGNVYGTYNHNAHNDPFDCGPANAQNQIEQIELLEKIDQGLQAFNAGMSEGSLKAKLEFAYSDVAQRQIYPARSGQLITRIVLIITEPFNDLEARVSVGDDDNSDRLLPADSNDLTEPCTWSTHPNFAYPQNSSVSLFLTPAGSTQGRGIVYLYCD